MVLLHVADGWAARTYGADAVSREIAEDTAYLATVRAEFHTLGIPGEAELAYGDPSHRNRKIWVKQKGCDLVAAMSTHTDIASLATYFSAPPPAASSTASASPSSSSGRNNQPSSTCLLIE